MTVEPEEECIGPLGVDTVCPVGISVAVEFSGCIVVGASSSTCSLPAALWAATGAATGNDCAGAMAVMGDLGFLSGDLATDRGSVNAAGRSVRNAIAGLILAGFGLALAAGACTFGGCGGVGLVPVGVTSVDLSVLVGVSSIVECDVGTSDVRPLAISDSGLCIMFCEGGKWLELPGGLLARSRLSTRSL